MYTVLYVDDEAGLLEIGKLFLEESGQVIVDTITSASAALAMLTTRNYDAIISDYQMPGMDGIGFLKEVRRSGNTIPFILFTGRGREDIVIQALNEGADFYLQKGGEPVSQFAELKHQIIQAVKRKRAENELAISEEKYRRIVDTADEGVWQMDKNFNAVYVNQRMAEMLGYTVEEMLGRNLMSFVATEDLPDQTARMEERRQGKSGRYERRLITKNGSIRWMLVSATPLMDSHGTFMGSFAMYSDITERKTAETEIARRNEELQTAYEQLTLNEEELRQNYEELAKSQHLLLESEKQYRNVVEDQTEFISRFSPDGTHIFVNEAYCRYFGLKRDEILGHRFRPKIPIEDKERVNRFFASLTPDHPADSIEHRIIMPDGTIRWQWWNDRAIFDPSGMVSEYQSVGRDITEEKITEIALEESEQRKAAMIAAMPDLLFVLSRDGTYLDFQAADKNLLALPPSRIIGKNILDTGFDAEATKTVLQAISAAIETGTLQQLEYKIAIPAGIAWFEARLVRLEADRALGIVRDISERKKAESELRVAYEQITASEEELRSQYNELAQREQQIRESEENFQSLVETAPDAIYILVGEAFAYVNPAMVRLIGATSADQLLGMSFYDRIHPTFHEKIRERAHLIIDEHKPAGLNESVYLKMDGSPLEIESSVAPFRYHNNPAGLVILHDISQRKQAEKLLKESEERYRVLLQRSFDAVVVHRKGIVSLANQGAATLLGAQSPSELVGKNVLDFVHPDSINIVRERISAMTGGDGMTAVDIKEEKFLRIDGNAINVEVVATGFIDNGEPAVQVVFRDITERKRTEELLLRKSGELTAQLDALAKIEQNTRVSEERLLMAQNISLTGCWEYNAVTDTIWGSAEALRIFGFPPEAGDFPIDDVEACIPERERVHQALLDLIRGGKEYNLEYTINPADSSPSKIIHSVARIEKDAGGRPIRVMGVIQDITERKRAEEEITFKNRILSTQQETAPEGILIVNEQGVILNYNQKFIEIWGIPPDFIASRRDEPVLKYVVDQVADPEAFLSRVRYLYNHKDEKSFEEIILKDGRVLERFSAPILGEMKKYYGRVWYFRDISGRKRAEEALRLMNRKLHLLTGITRHDILNKITIVAGNLKVAEKKFNEPALVEILKKIESATTAIRTQIEFTQTYQDLGVQAPAWFRVCEVIRGVRPPEISLTCACDSCEIFTDPMITRVFFNLFDNTVKYGKGATAVTVECTQVRGALVIVFADNGVGGIPPDEKEKIFERGFGKNTGLGLFLAREILSITGITIAETGEPGKGARFEMTVPTGAYRFSSEP